MHFRSLLWVPLALVLSSTTVFATPLTVSYAVGAHHISVGEGFAAAAADGFDGANASMVGTLTFALPTQDYIWWDPQNSLYIAPFAELHMQFFNDDDQPIVSVDLTGPLVASLNLYQDGGGRYFDWAIRVLGANDLSVFFGGTDLGWQNDSANNLLRIGNGVHPEFDMNTADYSVYGPGHINLTSVPEPSSMLLYGMGFVAVAVGRLRRRQ